MLHWKIRPARTACAALTLVASILTVSTATANAATTQLTQPGWCGWHPANTEWNPGKILLAPLNLRDGQSTLCNRLGTFNSSGWGQLNVDCYTTNGAGEVWYYVDSALGNGWVFSGDVIPVFNAQGC